MRTKECSWWDCFCRRKGRAGGSYSWEQHGAWGAVPLLPGANPAFIALTLSAISHWLCSFAKGQFCRSGHQLPLAAAWFACALHRLWKKMSRTKRERIQTQADTTHLGLAGQLDNCQRADFLDSKPVKGWNWQKISAAGISLEKPCLLCTSLGARDFEGRSI